MASSYSEALRQRPLIFTANGIKKVIVGLRTKQLNESESLFRDVERICKCERYQVIKLIAKWKYTMVGLSQPAMEVGAFERQ